jgi:hypothetical protein
VTCWRNRLVAAAGSHLWPRAPARSTHTS